MPKLQSQIQDALRAIRLHILQEGFAEIVVVCIAILIVLMAVSLAAGYYMAVNYEGYEI